MNFVEYDKKNSISKIMHNGGSLWMSKELLIFSNCKLYWME